MKTVNIGLLGGGNIGCGVWTLLRDMRQDIQKRCHLDLRVTKILVRDINEPRPCALPRELLTTDPHEVTRTNNIQIVAEFMGGIQPAAMYMQDAMAHKKAVVTANKAALATQGAALRAAASANHVGLHYEASVCAAIPIIGALKRSLQASRVTRVMGIINGTTNYILSEMALHNTDYQQVLREAQRLGLAEPDPSSDVQGRDAAYKLSILASLAFGGQVAVQHIYTEGITNVTPGDIRCGKDMGYALKLLAIAKMGEHGAEARVHPAFLPNNHPLAGVNGAFNAVHLTGHACGDMTFIGKGAGPMPTAGAVLSDIINAAEALAHLYIEEDTQEQAVIMAEDWQSAFFIRLLAEDTAGVPADVAACFAREQVSIASMVQRGEGTDGRVPLIFTTRPVSERAMRRALENLPPSACSVQSVIRVES